MKVPKVAPKAVTVPPVWLTVPLAIEPAEFADPMKKAFTVRVAASWILNVPPMRRYPRR